MNFFDKIKGLLCGKDITVIHGSKNTGKTNDLIELASKDSYSCIVVTSVAVSREIEKLIAEKGYSIKVMTFNQFSKKEFVGRDDIKNFYFDDIDKILKGIAYPRKIKGITFTTDNTKLVENTEVFNEE